MDFDSKTFSYRLTALMEEIDISQVELGKRIGISNVTISRYINGERIPRLDIIIKLANVFNVSTDYLLGITKNRKQKSISGNIDNDISEIASTLFSFDKNEHLNKNQIKFIKNMILTNKKLILNDLNNNKK